MRLISRKALIVVLTGILIFAFTAQSTVAGETVINFIASVGGSGKSFAGGVERFNEKYKGQYRVEVTLVAWESVLEKAVMQFMSRRPTYDVLAVDGMWIPAVRQYLEPLDPYVARFGPEPVKLFGRGALRDLTYHGKIIAFPIRSGVILNYYRKDLLDAAGLKVPRTLDEYTAAARKLTRKDASGKVHVYGTSLMAQHPTWTTWSFSQFARPHGISFLTDDNTGPSPALKESGTLQILKFIKNLQDEGLTPNPLAWTYDDNVVAFQNGRLAMTPEMSVRALLLEDHAKSQVAGKMGYDVLPAGKLGPDEPAYAGGYWTLAIDKNSKVKEAAYQFIKFMTSLENQKYMAIKWSNGPTALALYDDPEYIKINPAAPAIKKVLEGIGYAQDFPVRQNPELTKVVHEEMQVFLLGRQTAEQTGMNMFNRIKEVMEQ
ncbi:MAG: sugar ABC transporter substrate-binding protein [Firmicutes bacterium]|nr:sugar ABC transporter substrate-binding protein [Bacillota bacterium]